MLKSTIWYDPEGSPAFVSRNEFKAQPFAYWRPVGAFFVTMGLAYLAEYFFKENAYFQANSFKHLWDLIIICAGISYGFYGFYIRRDRIRSAQNHSFYHRIRNRYISNFRKMKRTKKASWDDSSIGLIVNFADEAAELLAVHFRELCRNGKIDCCIRLAYQDNLFKTIGRSKALGDRGLTSKAISDDKGLPQALKDFGCRKAAIIRDIKTAIAERIWLKVDNDNLPNINSVIALPINIIEEDDTSAMLGILFITSPLSGWCCPFKKRNAEQACGFADALAVYFHGLLTIKEDQSNAASNKKSPSAGNKPTSAKQTTKRTSKTVKPNNSRNKN